jgi:hypothetical protein
MPSNKKGNISQNWNDILSIKPYFHGYAYPQMSALQNLKKSGVF